MSDPSPTLIKDPNRGFRTWHRDEIYDGDNDGLYVPNPNDLIIDFDNGWFRVSEVDYTTGLSTLVPWAPPVEPEQSNIPGVLLGDGPGYPSESYRLFLDTSVTPYTLAPDANLRFYGSLVDHYKVFKGSDITEDTGVVISRMYDNSQNFLGDSIPVEDIAGETAIQAPMVGYTNENLPHGEVVTLVAYNDEGGAISRALLIVVHSQAIRQSDASKKFVSSITIESSFISEEDPKTLEFPINVTVESLPMEGKVHYSDGSSVKFPIDGNPFAIFGLNDYIATVVGQNFPIVLSYQLAGDEIAYGMTPGANGRITEDYKAKTLSIDGSYEVKLFVYPTWVDATTGYRLEFWMYNLNRDTFYNVTPHVQVGASSPAFNGLNYGSIQTLTYAIDIDDVDNAFSPYRHVQAFQVALLAEGTQNADLWEVFYTPNSGESFGRGLRAELENISANNWTLNLKNGFASKALWLDGLYYAVEPLYNQSFEVEPPEPTHFRVVFQSTTYEYSVDQWEDDLTGLSNDLDDGELLYIQWIKRQSTGDLQLGITGLPARQIGV